MKLSAAIREGVMVTEPGMGVLFEKRMGFEQKACVVGAALAGVLGLAEALKKVHIHGVSCCFTVFPELVQDCPLELMPKGIADPHSNIFDALVYMNDMLETPRTAIADALERAGL